ncbi:hypothetical protein IE53DRAFT_389743 [Violaceomyces palustris]|uniref:Uncharacterized protein n=1 Tax=Violaceomyces palustris TaxID=1673888 RepID=A0ACD0NQL1_9BASI|nr:hypothetical protein IE53DRAFT_389743 [Violaceomyces palustris]
MQSLPQAKSLDEAFDSFARFFTESDPNRFPIQSNTQRFLQPSHHQSLHLGGPYHGQTFTNNFLQEEEDEEGGVDPRSSSPSIPSSYPSSTKLVGNPKSKTILQGGVGGVDLAGGISSDPYLSTRPRHLDPYDPHQPLQNAAYPTFRSSDPTTSWTADSNLQLAYPFLSYPSYQPHHDHHRERLDPTKSKLHWPPTNIYHHPPTPSSSLSRVDPISPFHPHPRSKLKHLPPPPPPPPPPPSILPNPLLLQQQSIECSEPSFDPTTHVPPYQRRDGDLGTRLQGGRVPQRVEVDKVRRSNLKGKARQGERGFEFRTCNLKEEGEEEEGYQQTSFPVVVDDRKVGSRARSKSTRSTARVVVKSEEEEEEEEEEVIEPQRQGRERRMKGSSRNHVGSQSLIIDRSSSPPKYPEIHTLQVDSRSRRSVPSPSSGWSIWTLSTVESDVLLCEAPLEDDEEEVKPRLFQTQGVKVQVDYRSIQRDQYRSRDQGLRLDPRSLWQHWVRLQNSHVLQPRKRKEDLPFLRRNLNPSRA